MKQNSDGRIKQEHSIQPTYFHPTNTGSQSMMSHSTSNPIVLQSSSPLNLNTIVQLDGQHQTFGFQSVSPATYMPQQSGSFIDESMAHDRHALAHSQSITIPSHQQTINNDTNTNTQGNTNNIQLIPNQQLCCHQCKSSKPEVLIHLCSAIVPTRKHQCRKKYCVGCLRRTYNLGPSDTAFPWSCPSCQGRCTCAACVRARAKQNGMAIESPVRRTGNSHRGSTGSEVVSVMLSGATSTSVSNDASSAESSPHHQSHRLGSMMADSSSRHPHLRTSSALAGPVGPTLIAAPTMPSRGKSFPSNIHAAGSRTESPSPAFDYSMMTGSGAFTPTAGFTSPLPTHKSLVDSPFGNNLIEEGSSGSGSHSGSASYSNTRSNSISVGVGSSEPHSPNCTPIGGGTKYHPYAYSPTTAAARRRQSRLSSGTGTSGASSGEHSHSSSPVSAHLNQFGSLTLVNAEQLPPPAIPSQTSAGALSPVHGKTRVPSGRRHSTRAPRDLARLSGSSASMLGGGGATPSTPQTPHTGGGFASPQTPSGWTAIQTPDVHMTHAGSLPQLHQPVDFPMSAMSQVIVPTMPFVDPALSQSPHAVQFPSWLPAHQSQQQQHQMAQLQHLQQQQQHLEIQLMHLGAHASTVAANNPHSPTGRSRAYSLSLPIQSAEHTHLQQQLLLHQQFLPPPPLTQQEAMQLAATNRPPNLQQHGGQFLPPVAMSQQDGLQLAAKRAECVELKLQLDQVQAERAMLELRKKQQDHEHNQMARMHAQRQEDIRRQQQEYKRQRIEEGVKQELRLQLQQQHHHQQLQFEEERRHQHRLADKLQFRSDVAMKLEEEQTTVQQQQQQPQYSLNPAAVPAPILPPQTLDFEQRSQSNETQMRQLQMTLSMLREQQARLREEKRVYEEAQAKSQQMMMHHRPSSQPPTATDAQQHDANMTDVQHQQDHTGAGTTLQPSPTSTDMSPSSFLRNAPPSGSPLSSQPDSVQGPSMSPPSLPPSLDSPDLMHRHGHMDMPMLDGPYPSSFLQTSSSSPPGSSSTASEPFFRLPELSPPGSPPHLFSPRENDITGGFTMNTQHGHSPATEAQEFARSVLSNTMH